MRPKRNTTNPVRRHRLERGISAYALARTVGTTPSHIGRIERDESAPSVHLALAIADALKANVRDLFPGRAA